MDLTKGSIVKGILIFTIPLFLGQLMQQFYNLADAWVVGNYADNEAFAAVSSAGSLTKLIIGFFNGMGTGGGVIISRYFGAKDKENLERTIHTNFLFAVVASVFATILGLAFVRQMLVWMNTPDSVMGESMAYLRVYFGGVSTVIIYNMCMAIMRALGDSVRPLYYLIFSSFVNVGLDLLFVAGFHWGVTGAAVATVIAQGVSCVMCIVRMTRAEDDTRLQLKKLLFYPAILKEVVSQGLPTGVQNSVVSVGNIVIQSNINMFGAYAMSGHGAYSKIEGLVFLPITCLSQALPTFVSQNLGAGEYERAKKGSVFSIVFGILFAELIGILLFFGGETATRFLVNHEEAIRYGVINMQITAPFFFLLAFSHGAAGVLRGRGKSFIPMVTMISFWCFVRIIYVTIAVKIFPVYGTIAWAYPITWGLSSIVFLVILLRLSWKKPQ